VKKVLASQVVTTLRRRRARSRREFRRCWASSLGQRGRVLLALSVGVGLGVVHELMELEVDEVVGAKGKQTAIASQSVTATRRVDDLGRPAGRGPPPADTNCRRRARAAG